MPQSKPNPITNIVLVQTDFPCSPSIYRTPIYTAKSSDTEFRNILDLRNTLGEYASTPNFNENLVKKFSQIHPSITNFEIKQYFSRETLNSKSHKIIMIDGKESFHVKPTIQTFNKTDGTKYNELFYYKMCEHLGIGPRCDGIVMEDSGALFILTEDLSTRNLKGSLKEISFATRKQDIDKFKTIPNRDKDNIHRVVLNLATLLMDLDDLKSNTGNTGIKKTIQADSPQIKEKVFLVDFTICEMFGIFGTNDHKNLFEFISKILQGEDVSQNPIYKSYLENFFIPCKLDKDTLETAIQKLCIDDEGNPAKFLKAIDDSKKYTLELLEKSNYATLDDDTLEQDKEIHRQALEQRVAKQRQIIKEFLEVPAIKDCIDKKISELKSKRSIAEISTSEIIQTLNSDESSPTREAPPIKFSRVTQLSEDNERKDDSPSPSTQSSTRTISASPVSRTDSPFSPSPY